MCVYAVLCVFVSVSMCTNVCMYVSVCMCMCVYMYVSCIHVCMWCMYVRAYTSASVYLYSYEFMCSVACCSDSDLIVRSKPGNRRPEFNPDSCS